MSIKPQGQLHTKLAGLRPQIMTRPGKNGGSDFGITLPAVHTWTADGVDHINLWEEGETELGRILSHRCELVFDHSHLGRFKTMEALDKYVMSRDRDDRIRNLTGPALKKHTANIVNAPVTNFRAIIMDSNWQRVKQYPDLANVMKDSTLPFDVYYILRTSGMRVRPTRYQWLIAGFEEIRRALKEGREPDFNFLKEKKEAETYEFIHRKGAKPANVQAKKPAAKPQQAATPKAGKTKPALEIVSQPGQRDDLKNDAAVLGAEVSSNVTIAADTIIIEGGASVVDPMQTGSESAVEFQPQAESVEAPAVEVGAAVVQETSQVAD